ncbi:hypothetical protein ACLQ2Y_26180 [Micromonospora echinospora]|uniref:hypothetical protein n=1 Tax=Micromonospora echinospora TaxID=1877 RepID=UPI003CEBE990
MRGSQPRAGPGWQFVLVAPRGNHWRYEDFYTNRDLAREKGLPRRMTMHGLRRSLLMLLAHQVGRKRTASAK